jgi:hypothetical protein
MTEFLSGLFHVESVSVVGPVGGKIDALARPVCEVVAELGTAVPPDDWARVPKDLAENLDHYLYGKPKAAS